MLRLAPQMPVWFRAFAAARLSDLYPDAVESVELMSDADLRQFYAAVRTAGADLTVA